MMKLFFAIILFSQLAQAQVWRRFGGDNGTMSIRRGCVRSLSENAQTNLNRNIEEIFTKMHQCSEDHPELKRYIDQWMSLTFGRRELGMSCSRIAQGLDIEGINTRFRILLKPALIKALIRPRNVFSYYEGGNDTYIKTGNAMDTMAHEFFHSTDCNAHGPITHANLEDINPPELQVLNASSAFLLNEENILNSENTGIAHECKKDIIFDRIQTVTAICLKSERKKNRVENYIGQRILTCGLKKGCMDIFTKDGSTKRLGRLRRANRDLSQEDAQKLCLRLAKSAQCLQDPVARGEMPTTYDEIMTPSRDLAQWMLQRLTPLKMQLTQIVNRLLFLSSIRLHRSQLEFMPELQEEFNVLKNSNNGCYREAFNEGGHLNFTHHLLFQQSTLESYRLNWSSRKKLVDHFIENKNRWTNCQGELANPVISLLSKIAQKEEERMRNPVFGSILDLIEADLNLYSVRQFRGRVFTDEKIAELMGQLPQNIIYQFVRLQADIKELRKADLVRRKELWDNTCVI